MCTGAGTVVRAVCGNGKGFEMGVGMRQGSAFGPLLFVVVMEAMSGEFGVALPWELLCADGLAVVAETEEELSGRLDGWKDGVESGGVRVNMNRAKIVVSGERRRVGRGCGMAVWGLQWGCWWQFITVWWLPEVGTWEMWKCGGMGWRVESGKVICLRWLFGPGGWCGSHWCGCWGQCRVGVGGWVLLPGWHAGCGWGCWCGGGGQDSSWLEWVWAAGVTAYQWGCVFDCKRRVVWWLCARRRVAWRCGLACGEGGRGGASAGRDEGGRVDVWR